ncbi:NERD domain-containing protein [Comamonas nitrativorans]|uniref:NERD domain-containing protein n=1 Tax=Comamonas nitrativorans TaxID=108437 RepID=A0ABV9H0U0_9BURK
MAAYVLFFALFFSSAGWADTRLPRAVKNTVFKCQIEGKTHYSDSPCPDAIAVDVTPTRGVDSMSGTKRISAEVQREILEEKLAKQKRQIVTVEKTPSTPKALTPAAPLKNTDHQQRAQPSMNIFPVMLQAVKPFFWLIPFFVIIFLLRSPFFKGWLGEKMVRRALEENLDKNNYLLLHDVTLEDQMGSTQIDHIVVSPYGIFVLETKHYKGWISGHERDAQWQQTNFQKKNRFQNPLRQNYRHIKALEGLLGVPMNFLHSVIVFSGTCELKSNFPANVCTTGNFLGFIKTFKEQIIPAHQMQAIWEKIEGSRLAPTHRTHQAHVEQLRKRHGR